MSSSVKNVYQFRTTSKITQGQGATSTFDIGNDIFTNTAVTITAGSVKLENRTGSQVELMTLTATGGTATIATRGILPDGTTSTSYQYERPRNTLCTVTILENQLTNKIDTNTFTATQTFTDIGFTGTTTGGLKVKSLTTAQRDALGAPANGMIVYNTTTSELNQYIGGAWSAISAGSTQPNASETVAGKVEIATQAEFDAGTATGGTGAILSPTTDQIRKQINTATAKTTPVNADSLGIADSAASGVIKKTTITEFKAAANLQATTTTSGFVELATDAEVATGTDQTRYTNPLQLRTNSKSTTGTTTRATSDSTGSQTIAHGLGVAPRLVEFKYANLASISGNTMGVGSYDGTTNRALGVYDAGATSDYRVSATLCIERTSGAGVGRTASATVDATNITLSRTKGGAGSDLGVLRTAHA